MKAVFWATVLKSCRISQKIFESTLPRTCEKIFQKRRTSGLRRNFLFKCTLPRNSSKKSSKTVFKSSPFWPSSKICAKCFNFFRGQSQRDPCLISRVLRSKLQSFSSLPGWATLSFRARRMLKTVVKGKCLGSPSNRLCSFRACLMLKVEDYANLRMHDDDANKKYGVVASALFA